MLKKVLIACLVIISSITSFHVQSQEADSSSLHVKKN